MSFQGSCKGLRELPRTPCLLTEGLVNGVVILLSSGCPVRSDVLLLTVLLLLVVVRDCGYCEPGYRKFSTDTPITEGARAVPVAAGSVFFLSRTLNQPNSSQVSGVPRVQL